MKDIAQAPKKRMTYIEEVIVLVVLFFLATILDVETFPSRPGDNLKHLLAMLLFAFMLFLSVRIVWRDPPRMKVFGALMAVVSGLLLTLAIRFNFS